MTTMIRRLGALALLLGAFWLVPVGALEADHAARVVGRGAPVPAPLLGIVTDSARTGHLSRIDHRTLRPVGKRVPLAKHMQAWSFSPDRRLVALGHSYTAKLSRPASLRIVDVRRMRLVAEIRLPDEVGYPLATAWLGERRIVLLLGAYQPRALLVDVPARKVIARWSFSGRVMRIGRTARELVLLIGPREGIGSAGLVTISAGLDLRSLELDRISAGTQPLEGDEPTARIRVPALAVDAVAGRAFVLGAGEPVAEVALGRLELAYHPLSEGRSSLERALDWLVPAAGAKSVEGPSRWARWLGRDTIVVAGTDSEPGGRAQSAGVHLVDTRSWTSRMLDPDAATFYVASDAIVTRHPASRRGLGVYGLDGTERFRLFRGRFVLELWAVGRRAFVRLAVPGEGSDPSPERSVRIVDLTSGKRLGQRLGPLPYLLLGDAEAPY